MNIFKILQRKKYEILIQSMKNIIVIPITKIELLANYFNFNSKPIYKKRENNDNVYDDNDNIELNNYYDCKLYNHFTI